MVANEEQKMVTGGVLETNENKMDVDTGNQQNINKAVENESKENEEKRRGLIHSALNTPNPLKRKQPGKGPPAKKPKSDKISLTHTPLSMLNQIIKGLEFKLNNASGPSHCPIYEMSVEIQGHTFVGNGVGKQQAKQNTAELVLASLFPAVLEKYRASKQSLMEHQSTPTQESNGTQISPVQDSTEGTKVVNDVTPPVLPVAPSVPLSRLALDKQGKLRKKALDALAGKVNPLAVLNEILPSVEFVIDSENNLGCLSKFVFHLNAEGQTFKGTGPSKKAAKTAAARAYFNYKFGNDPEAMVVIHDLPVQDPTSCTTKFPLLSPTLADAIADKILVKYDDLMVNSKEYARRKILAGICMTRTEEMTDAVVISIATGTKTVGGEYISVSGSSLNDSHAEVATRRGLLRYFYSQLLLANQIKEEKGENDCIFEKLPGSGFKLKDGIRFHLYITSSPCGDARIFSPHEVLEEDMLDRHPNRHSRGQLRTKIESGEGTIPVKPEHIQTWDGVMQGNRLLTMSCSDKILRWNLLGLQGTLLSHFISPIYVHSVVISNLYNEPHMYRALRGRIEAVVELQKLPEPFQFGRPYVNKTTSPEPRIPGKAPNHSVNWNIVDGTVEVVTMMTGKTVDGNPSRLAKVSMCNEFMKVLQAGVPSITGIKPNDFETYGDVKLKATTYEAAKNIFYGLFPQAGLGDWVRKPFEQNQFEVKKLKTVA